MNFLLAFFLFSGIEKTSMEIIFHQSLLSKNVSSSIFFAVDLYYIEIHFLKLQSFKIA